MDAGGRSRSCDVLMAKNRKEALRKGSASFLFCILPEGMEAAFRQARHVVRFFRLYTYIRLTSLTSVVRSSAGNQSIAVLPLSSCISASRDMRIICHVGSSFGRAPSSSMDTVP